MGDLIRREDAIKALTETEEVRGYAYVAIKQALEDIPGYRTENEQILFDEHN